MALYQLDRVPDAPRLRIEPLASVGGPFKEALLRHYTESKGSPAGKKLGWGIWEGSALRGYLGLAEPSARLAARRALGIENIEPLPGTYSNFFYRLEAPGAWRASEILIAWHSQLADDWAERYPLGAKYPTSHRPVHVETMVDAGKIASVNPGYCYKLAGYKVIGGTTGRGARRPPGSTHGPRVWGDVSRKIVLYHGPLPVVRAPEMEPPLDRKGMDR